jgi:hypothetical protein
LLPSFPLFSPVLSQGEVFTVEVALDLRGLNSMINQRKRVSEKESPVNIYATAVSVRESESVKEMRERERERGGS